MEMPAILIGAVIVISLASLALHLLFPPACSSARCPMKEVLPRNPLETETKQKKG